MHRVSPTRTLGSSTALRTATAILLLPAAASWAQQAPPSDAPSLIEEVTVTARKRAENLQDTPISISAYSAESIEARGVTKLEEIARFTPNLVFQNNPGFNGSNSVGAVFIRGIGQKDFVPTTEPGVGIYLDGVYIARSLGALLDVVDLERVEVLRGPQGTLFGRNTIGGAVSLVSRKPEPDFSASGSATYGSDDRMEFKGSVNLPLSDTVYMRVLGAYLGREDGYVKQPLTGQELGSRSAAAGRLALRWQPTDTLDVQLAVDGTRDRQDGAPLVLRAIDFSSSIFNPEGLPLLPPGSPATPGAYVIQPGVDVPVDNFALLHNYITTVFAGAGNCLGVGAPTYDPAGDQTNPLCYGPQYIGESSRVNLGSVSSRSDADVWGGSLDLDWEITATLSLRSITAWRELDSTFAREDDLSPLSIAQVWGQLDQRQFSQELQLLGRAFDSRLNWIVGGYYFDEKAEAPDGVDFTPVTIQSGGTVWNESHAFFAQATYDITPALSITGGARYTRDDKTFLPEQMVLDGKTSGLPVGLPVLPAVKVSVMPSKTTPLVNVAYKWTPDVLTYVSYTEGFKSGGFTQRVFPPLPATPVFKPETVESYEAGVKLSTFQGRMRLNGALFHTDYDDIQVQIFRGVAPEIGNAAKARVRGFELELQGSPGGGWFIEAGVGYTDPEFKELGDTVAELTADSKFEKVSKWMLSAALQKDIWLGRAGTLSPRLDWSYRSKFYNDALNREIIAQPSYHLTNAVVSWSSLDEHYGLGLGVSNVLDEEYNIVGLGTPTIGALQVMPDRGREWYMTVRVKF